MDSMHRAVKDWLEPEITLLAASRLDFNFSAESPDSFAVITRYSGRVVREFINGDTEKEYGFAVVITKSYSTEPDDLNLEAMDFAQEFMDWLDEQDRHKQFPDLGEGREVLSTRNLQNMPNLAAVNADEGLARYQVQGSIRYREYAH